MAAFSQLLMLHLVARAGPVHRRRGRPRTRPVLTLLGGPPLKHRGGQRRFTDDDRQWLVSQVDRIKAIARKQEGLELTDAAALERSIRIYFKKKFVLGGMSEAEAVNNAKALDVRGSSLFKTRKVDLARARKRLQEQSRRALLAD